MSTYRKTILSNEHIYHIYNRGVEKRNIFINKKEYQRAVNAIQYYQFDNLPYKFSRFLVQPAEKKAEILTNFQQSSSKLVNILAFCLMPNHFHILLRQNADQGITRFMAKFTNSYTKYFNTKHGRVGPLVQGLFKSVWVEDDEQLIHLGRYIHLNPVVSFITNEHELETYPWSSLPEYLGMTNGFCETQTILSYFPSVDEYRKFIYDQISYAKNIKKIEHLTLES